MTGANAHTECSYQCVHNDFFTLQGLEVIRLEACIRLYRDSQCQGMSPDTSEMQMQEYEDADDDVIMLTKLQYSVLHFFPLGIRYWLHRLYQRSMAGVARVVFDQWNGDTGENVWHKVCGRKSNSCRCARNVNMPCNFVLHSHHKCPALRSGSTMTMRLQGAWHGSNKNEVIGYRSRFQANGSRRPTSFAVDMPR